MRKGCIFRLLKRYWKHRSAIYREQVNEWYDIFDEEVSRIPEIPQGKLEQLWISIEGRIGYRVRVRRFKTYISVAAMVLLVLGMGLWLYFLPLDGEKKLIAVEKQEIFPAKGVPVLWLSNGEEVYLDRKRLIQEGKVLIKNDSTDVLDYSNVGNCQSEELYNTIRVPIGGEYRVVLADGTCVHLNSCSLLTYPVAFKGDTRIVTLKGEAYFEVTKSSKPFIVNTSGLVIRVLGTSFNVSDYSGDKIATTTLLEGRVKVYGQESGEEYDITPGCTLVYTKDNGLIYLQDSDVELYTAWLDGKLRFEGMRIEDIMHLLKRWYDCEIEYEDEELKNLHYSGVAEKNRPVSYLLRMMEEVTDVCFEIEGKKIRMSWKR